MFVYFGHGKVTILHKIFLKKKNMCWKYQIFAKDLTYPLMHSIHYEADVNMSPVLSLFDKNTDSE